MVRLFFCSFVNPQNDSHQLRCLALGSGSFFNFEVHDGKTDMKVTAFMEQCHKFFDVVEEGAILLISGGNAVRRGRSERTYG